MSRYLIKTTEQYRVDSESEAKALIEEAKKEKGYTLAKYSSEYKERKVKGEVADAWYRVTLNKNFADEKEPDCTVSVSYEIVDGAFPSPRDTIDEEETFPFSEDAIGEDEE